MQEYFLIGTVLKPQGIHGECKIKSFAEDIESFRDWPVLYRKTEDGYTPVPCRVTRIHEGFVYAVPENCATANDAERFRGTDLYIDRAHVADSSENETLIADLIGCEAADPEGHVLGTLTDVLQVSSVDTWVFRTDRGTMMAPALLKVFPEVDTARRRITVIPERLEEVAVYED